MTPLQANDFAAFMQEVTGFPPFPWQRRLLDQVLEEEGWPDLLDLPTGTGKTSVLLIALFAMAVAPERSPRRVALVVDRRIIVDQVDGYATKIATALEYEHPARPISARVAAKLRGLTSAKGAKPVRVVHLRGGIPRDDAWLHTPDQPTIISSTVDQVGSRLLFRGYGVTPCMRPVHAGVLARDTLYFLDEVHLATAFEQTLDRLQRTYEDWAELSPSTGRPFQVVCMSATPRPTSADLSIFRLGKDDHKHRVLAKRLGVSRRATLQVVKTKKAVTPAGRQQNRKAIARVASGLAKTAADGGATAIGVVVNRVDTARRIATSLQKNHVDASVLLLTGRMRPYERTEIQATLDKTAASGAKRPPGATPTFVVATSCIEAGADLDFDALITEVASLDALRQRFGRLNRLGNYDHAPAWILAASDQVAASAKPDPIYGTAVRETWTYLNEIAESSTVDFGLRRFVEPELERRKMLLPAAVEAPVLFPSYLDMWSETRPAPHPDPDVSLWLHGKDSQVDRDVNLVFRANVPASEERASDFNERIEFLRPLSEEAVSVPLHELRAWLKKGNKAWAWAWRSEGLEWIEAAKLQPGDTILVDATSGGISQGTWNPESATPVEDVAERAAFRIHGLAKLRVDPLTLPKSLTKNLPFPPDSDDPETLANRHEHCLAWLQSLPARFQAEPETWGDWQPLLHALGSSQTKPKLSVTTVYRKISNDDTNTTAQKLWQVALVEPQQVQEATTEDDVSAFSGVEVSLASHLEDVRAWATWFASAGNIGEQISEDIALAALLHDIGKADWRFQAMLRGGDPVHVGEPIAKSRLAGSAKTRARAAQRSTWPRGFRHELISLALFDASPDLQTQAHDLDLVRHLIASHHGWCRPWPPAAVDENPQTVTCEVAGVQAKVSTAALDENTLNQCVSRFRRLTRRYGWHGLAYLEAVLRLGDHQASRTPGEHPSPGS